MKEEKDMSAIDLLISNYLSGNATSAQYEELKHWLEASKENRIYFSQQKVLWLYSEEKATDNQKEKWEQLKFKLKSQGVNIQDSEKDRQLLLKRAMRKFRYAASIAILLGISVLSYFIWKPRAISLSAQSELIVPYGSRSMLTLPDGTKLWANSGSKISYNTGFGKNNRDISLVGEAYFDVAKNPKLPFVVHAANVKIKAIGTAFNVKAYPEERKVETTLVRGLVEVEEKGAKGHIFLKPMQKVVFSNIAIENVTDKSQPKSDEQNKAAVTGERRTPEVKLQEEIDEEKETGWKDGKLIFDREPLGSLVIQLERRYDVHFTFVDEKLKDYRYTGTFNDVSLEQIMEAMRYSSPVDYVIKEKEVKITDRNMHH
ncbi:MAG TPA: FecR domain-containing protein [Bacteroidales bacterium]